MYEAGSQIPSFNLADASMMRLNLSLHKGREIPAPQPSLAAPAAPLHHVDGRAEPTRKACTRAAARAQT